MLGSKVLLQGRKIPLSVRGIAGKALPLGPMVGCLAGIIKHLKVTNSTKL